MWCCSLEIIKYSCRWTVNCFLTVRKGLSGSLLLSLFRARYAIRSSNNAMNMCSPGLFQVFPVINNFLSILIIIPEVLVQGDLPRKRTGCSGSSQRNQYIVGYGAKEKYAHWQSDQVYAPCPRGMAGTTDYRFVESHALLTAAALWRLPDGCQERQALKEEHGSQSFEHLLQQWD